MALSLKQVAENNDAIAFWDADGNDLIGGGAGNHDIGAETGTVTKVAGIAPTGGTAVQIAGSVQPTGWSSPANVSDLMPSTTAGRRFAWSGWVVSDGEAFYVNTGSGGERFGFRDNASGKSRWDCHDESNNVASTGTNQDVANYDGLIHHWTVFVVAAGSGTEIAVYRDGLFLERDTVADSWDAVANPSAWVIGGRFGADCTVQGVAIHHLPAGYDESQIARELYLVARLNKTHPAIVQLRKLIDAANPGFVVAPGVPGAAAVGDALVADQATDPIAHGELKNGASIGDGGGAIGAFTGTHINTDGNNDRLALGGVGAMGSQWDAHGIAMACAMERTGSAAGAIFAGQDASGNWLVVQLLASDQLQLLWTDATASNYQIYETLGSVDPRNFVFALDTGGNGFVVSPGATPGSWTVGPSAGTPPTIGDFDQAMLGNELSGLGAGNGLPARSRFAAGVAGPKAASLTEGEGWALSAAMQARRSGGRVPGLSRLPHFPRI